MKPSRALALAASAGLTPLLLTACGTSGISSPTAEPTSTAINSELDGVACATPTHCVAVGESHTYSPFAYRTLIEDSTGGAWAIVPSPSSPTRLGSRLNDVTCPSPNLCIAVGYNQDAASTPTTLIEENSGSGWTIVPSPNPTSFGAPYGVLKGVTCISASDCIAVGAYDSDSASSLPLIEEERGNGWTIVPGMGSGTGDLLEDVACPSVATCFAVGSAGDQTGDLIMQRANDGQWTIAYDSFAPPCASGKTCIRLGGLDDVSCSSAASCIATGFGFLDYAGGRWADTSDASETGTLPSHLTCGPDDCTGASPLEDGGILIEQRRSGYWSSVATLKLNVADLYVLVTADIACSGTHCVVVGSQSIGGVAMASDSSQTLIAEGQGSQWAVVPSPNVPFNLASPSTAQ
jgi:hypothetical protein